jgi:hypothetical protein
MDAVSSAVSSASALKAANPPHTTLIPSIAGVASLPETD